MATKKSATKPAAAKSGTSGKQEGKGIEEDLAALDSTALQTNPIVPVKVALLEAQRCWEAGQDAKAQLVKLKSFDMVHWTDLPARIDALAKAERAWQQTRHAPKEAGGVGAQRKEAEALRSAVMGALRYLLRKDPKVMAELDRIAEGDGLADLIGDLEDLLALLEQHPGVVDGAIGVPDDAPSRLAELAGLLKKRSSTVEATALQERRNGLFILVEESVAELRAAARYLFQKDPKRLAPFLSQHEAERRRRARKKPAAGEPTNRPADT
jgi:hypothetical protein